MKIKHLSLIFSMMILIGCNDNNPSKIPLNKNDAFLALFPKCEMNSNIRFLPNKEPAKLSGTIWLNFQNYSETTMSFPSDLNLKIFVYNSTDSEQWVPIINNIKYLSKPLVLEPKSSGIESIASTSIKPILTKLPQTIRVSITTNANTECYGAFIDMEVVPQCVNRGFYNSYDG